MHRQWYLIDDEGIHPLDLGQESEDFWEKFTRDGEEGPWPAFSQVVVDASATRTVEGLFRTAPELEVDLEEVTDQPELWDGSMMVARAEELTVISEPGVDLDDRVMAAVWAEELIAHLRCDGAFLGYDPAAGTLFLTVFSEGKPQFAWSDSLSPGPSYAIVFQEDGQCTNEDPRRFALVQMDMPETSPLLDRHQFLLVNLRKLGLNSVSPQLEDLPIAAVLARKPDE